MNRATHQLVAGAAVGIYLVKRESATGATTIKPLLGSAVAAFFTNLPAMFHSLAFAALLGTCLYQLNQWQTETELESLLKGAGMLALSAYLIHLALDFTTAKSLPLIG